MAYYTRVEYIESDGNQYIDTGVPVNATPVEYDFKYALANTTQHDKYVTGFKAGNLVASFGIYNGKIYTSYGKDTAAYHATIPADTEPHEIKVNATGTYVDGVYMKPTDYTMSVSSGTGNHYIFQRYYGTTWLQRGAFRVYYFKLYHTDGTLIRDFVPCKSSDGEYGLWDNVTKQFFGNQGTGTFVSGDVVIQEKPTLPLGCTLIEYIESSGTQYLDTGFKPNNNTGVVIDFEPTSASTQNTAYSFFGTRSAKEDGEYFAFFKASSTNFNLYWEFAELYSNIWNVANKTDFTTRRTVVVNGASATVGGVTKTYPARTFQTKLNMYLFADNEKGAAGYPAYMKLYSCQIYDNSTLIRDYVPIKDADGVCGLWDCVEGKFYENQGSGTFIAGPVIVEPEETTAYRWKIQGDALVSVGENDNPITTLSGGIVDGLFENALYRLATPFKLLHNKEWVLEWTMTDIANENGMVKIFDVSGDKATNGQISIVARKKSGSISFAIYVNDGSRKETVHYGVKLGNYGIDHTQRHTYRLCNKVSEDETNMVWLYVDGKKIAPMTDSFSASNNYGTDNWVSGRDFSFGFMGAVTYPLNGALNNFTVWENGIPAEAFNTITFLSGLTMGLCGKKTKKLITDMMLYNGTKLPAPPEWSDKEVYPFVEFPYVYIFQKRTPSGDKFDYTFYAFSAPLTLMKSVIDNGVVIENALVSRSPSDGRSLWTQQFYLENEEWEPPSDGAFTNYGPNYALCIDADGDRALIWSNHNVLNEDGSVYFAASTPIPVTDDVFTKGYLLGIELRNKRHLVGLVTWLTFASTEPFTIMSNYNSATGNIFKGWDGVLYYSTDTTTWNEWDGTAITSAEHQGEQKIYMRGIGNSKITSNADPDYHLVLTGNNIRCEGNIENLLDYQTVANGDHPIMSDYCFSYMFNNCTSLTAAPQLPADTLVDYCYYHMFNGCTNLTKVPALLATTLAIECYQGMFMGCTGIKLSEIYTDEYTVEYRVPIAGDGVMADGALIDMFTGTGGTFTGTPIINTTYYLHKDNEVVWPDTQLHRLNVARLGQLILA